MTRITDVHHQNTLRVGTSKIRADKLIKNKQYQTSNKKTKK